MVMRITNEILEAYLNCKTKGYLGDGRVETYPPLSYPVLLYDPRLMVDRSEAHG